MSAADGTLTLAVFDQAGCVIVEAVTDEGELAIPMTPEVARDFAVRLMIAADEAEKS